MVNQINKMKTLINNLTNEIINLQVITRKKLFIFVELYNNQEHIVI